MPLSAGELNDLLAIEGSVSAEEILHLHRLAAEVSQGCIVEVGSFRGRSTAALAMGSLAGFQVPVYAVDPHDAFVGYYGAVFGPEDGAAFLATMLRFELHRVVRIVNLSSEWLAREWPCPVRLLWIDGDHRLEGIMRDIDCWLPKLATDATIVFDDALDSAAGPFHAIARLCAAGLWRPTDTIGKTVTIVRGLGCGS